MGHMPLDANLLVIGLSVPMFLYWAWQSYHLIQTA